jgi:hypothetical protein
MEKDCFMTSSESISVNQWFCAPYHGQLCQVIETQKLWGEKTGLSDED